jgi:hypothetical protein
MVYGGSVLPRTLLRTALAEIDTGEARGRFLAKGHILGDDVSCHGITRERQMNGK